MALIMELCESVERGRGMAREGVGRSVGRGRPSDRGWKGKRSERRKGRKKEEREK